MSEALGAVMRSVPFAFTRAPPLGGAKKLTLLSNYWTWLTSGQNCSLLIIRHLKLRHGR